VLYFPFDSAHLEGAFLQQMQSLIASLRANPKAQLIINGHADRAGDDSYNLALSAKRAEYITNLLVKNGFSANRVTYYAFGETDPAIDTPDNVRERANRRVEIFLE
jgi:outer membrane protein OmpA-like peptidoglycan-associated protein